jgi:hypothetical protein
VFKIQYVFCVHRMKEVFEFSDGLVMAGVTLLVAGDKQIMIDNWNLGRDCLHLGLLFKFGHYDTLPWKALGLGHHDEAVARSCVHEAVNLWEAMSAGASACNLHNRTCRTKLLVSSSNSCQMCIHMVCGFA